MPERSCKIIERSFNVRISNERARARDKEGEEDARRRRDRSPLRVWTFREPAKGRCTIVTHAYAKRRRTLAYSSPHTFHRVCTRVYARGPVCIGSKNWPDGRWRTRRRRRKTGGRSRGMTWCERVRGEYKIAREGRESVPCGRTGREKVRIYR